jgi:hypothetical protein
MRGAASKCWANAVPEEIANAPNNDPKYGFIHIPPDRASPVEDIVFTLGSSDNAATRIEGC